MNESIDQHFAENRDVKVTQTEYETLADLRYSLRRFLRFSEEAAQSAGIRPQQHQALLAIKAAAGNHGITVGELAERLQVRHHSAVGLVNRLVLRGLVARRQNGADRRQVQLALTARGDKTLEKLSAVNKGELRRVGPHIESLLKRLHE